MGDAIVIVSGLPRSGTSMMMKMLEAGGVEVLTDGIREADEDNPRGYFELEKVKKLKTDPSWVAEARGRVIKVISQLLYDLPADHEYRVVFMRRRIEEILASQRRMLVRRGTLKEGGPSDEKMAGIMLRHVDQVLAWARGQPHLELLTVSYNEMFEDPAPHIAAVNEFLGGDLDTAAMAAVIDPSLYRQRG